MTSEKEKFVAALKKRLYQFVLKLIAFPESCDAKASGNFTFFLVLLPFAIYLLTCEDDKTTNYERIDT